MSTLVDQARKWSDAIEEGVAHGVYIVGGPADCAAPVLRQLADRVQELESTIQDSLKVADHVQPEKEERRPLSEAQRAEIAEDWATDRIEDIDGLINAIEAAHGISPSPSMVGREDTTHG